MGGFREGTFINVSCYVTSESHYGDVPCGDTLFFRYI